MKHLPSSTPRGVYVTPGTVPNGQRDFIAIDSTGTRIITASVAPGLDTRVVESGLWAMLDHYDAEPVLSDRRLQVIR